MTHKLGKDLTFGLIYDSDWSVFSRSKPLVFWPTHTNRSFLHHSTLISAAPGWSHYSPTWGQHAWQIFHILAGPLGSIPTLTSILKLFVPENPLTRESRVMFKKHALSSASQDISPALLLGASILQRSSHRLLEIRFAFLLLFIQGWHLLWKRPIPLFMNMPAAPGTGVVPPHMSPGFLFSIVRQYAGFLFLI